MLGEAFQCGIWIIDNGQRHHPGYPLPGMGVQGEGALYRFSPLNGETGFKKRITQRGKLNGGWLVWIPSETGDLFPEGFLITREFC